MTTSASLVSKRVLAFLLNQMFDIVYCMDCLLYYPRKETFPFLILFVFGIHQVFVDDAGSHAHSRSILEVPIFWFIYSEPLLLDKHYQARALSDMIIVVQSEHSSWESHLQCNGQSLLWNLRLYSYS